MPSERMHETSEKFRRLLPRSPAKHSLPTRMRSGVHFPARSLLLERSLLPASSFPEDAAEGALTPALASSLRGSCSGGFCPSFLPLPAEAVCIRPDIFGQDLRGRSPCGAFTTLHSHILQLLFLMER